MLTFLIRNLNYQVKEYPFIKMPPRHNPRNPYRSRTRKNTNPKRKGRGTPLLDLLRGAFKKRSNKEPRFDPEGTGYDYAAAKRAGIRPDKTGHWPSRVPATGQILKGAGHKTYSKTEEGEKSAGHAIRKDPNTGKRYSEMIEGIGKGWRARGDTQEERAKSYTGATQQKMKEDKLWWGDDLPAAGKPAADYEGKMSPATESWLTSGAASRGVTAPGFNEKPSSGGTKFPAGFLQPSTVETDTGERRARTADEIMKLDPSERTVGDKRALRLAQIADDKKNRAAIRKSREDTTRSTYPGATRSIKDQREAARTSYEKQFEGGLGAVAKEQAKQREARRKAVAKRAKDKKNR